MTSQLIQKAVSEVGKLRKEKWLDQPNGLLPIDSYNLALREVSYLLPQIITGVIEEIEKIVCERKCPFKDCKVCRDANIEIDEILKALKEVVKE